MSMGHMFEISALNTVVRQSKTAMKTHSIDW